MFRELHKAMSFSVSNRPLSPVKCINRNRKWLDSSTSPSVVCVALDTIPELRVAFTISSYTEMKYMKYGLSDIFPKHIFIPHK